MKYIRRLVTTLLMLACVTPALAADRPNCVYHYEFKFYCWYPNSMSTCKLNGTEMLSTGWELPLNNGLNVIDAKLATCTNALSAIGYINVYKVVTCGGCQSCIDSLGYPTTPGYYLQYQYWLYFPTIWGGYCNMIANDMSWYIAVTSDSPDVVSDPGVWERCCQY